MATVTGAWLLNDTLTFSITTGQESVVAISDGRQISGIQVDSSKLYYFFDDTVGSTTVYGKGNWGKESYKTIDFGTTEQTVSDNFYAWLTANATSQDAGESEDVLYSIHGSTLTGIADQVRRISGVEGELTPEQMTTNLLNVTPLGEYPKAEESAFGAESVAVEYGVTSVSPSGNYNGVMYPFNKFIANEAISIVGLRVFDNYGTESRHLRLLDASGNELARTETFSPTLSEWGQYYFEKPVNIAISEEFWVSSSAYNKPIYAMKGKATFNSKITVVGGECTWSDAIPAAVREDQLMGVVDIIIAPVSAELPNDYQITRTTMDDIAEEVQRITGTTDKMTTAQITTSLSAVVVHKDSEEVAF